jgi:hypothetical protein
MRLDNDVESGMIMWYNDIQIYLGFLFLIYAKK